MMKETTMNKHVTEERFDSTMPLIMRKADIQIATDTSTESREFDVVMSAGATVRRTRRDDNWNRVEFDEVLVVSEKSVDLTRVLAGSMMMLDSHTAYGGVTSTLGKIISARVENGLLMGRVRVHDTGVNDASDGLLAMIRGGTAPPVSVAYRILEARILPATKAGGVEQLIVERWEPYELSSVAVSADPDSVFRSAEAAEFPTTIIRAIPPETKEALMPKDTPVDPAGMTPAEAIVAERARSADIRKIGADHKLPAEMLQRALDGDTTVEAFRGLVLDHLAAESNRQPTVTTTRTASGDDPLVRRTAMEGALEHRIMARMGGKPEPMTEHQRHYANFGFADLAAEVVGEKRRVTAGLAVDVLERAFNTTSDFPLLLQNVTNKVLMARYELAQPTFKLFASERNLNDFRPANMLRAGDFPTLLKVGETGEIKAGTFSESKETFALATYARQVRFSRNLIINDDVDGIGQVIGSMGDRVAEFENNVFWTMVLANPLLGDGLGVFHATHNNLATPGAAIAVASVGAGRAAMRKQKSLDGMSLNIGPKYLLVGPDLETQAEQFTAQITAQTTANVNKIGPSLTPVVEAMITSDDWYLFADKGRADCFVYGHLNGASGPQVRTDEPFGVLGWAMECVLDYGVGAIDYRGAYLSEGGAAE
jgi:hypothetical protein